MAGVEVQLVDLVKRFADVTAVSGINVHVPGGEFFSLLGPSGCGKTTTLRLIAGFERPTGGRILLDGIDMAQTPPHKCNVNTVFQSYALFPHLDVYDNVAFGLRYQRASKQEIRRRVGEALSLARLEGMKRRRPSQLSGGQQQRAALARALVLGPAVLLLDEPLGAADAKLRKALQIELKSIQGPSGSPSSRHPRPGGGPDDVRPDRGHVQRPGRADRGPRATSTSARPRPMWRTSSGSPTS